MSRADDVNESAEIKSPLVSVQMILTACDFEYSSPSRSPVLDSEIVMMNTLYKERFPKVSLHFN